MPVPNCLPNCCVPNCRGTLLVDALVAVAILGMGAVSILGFISSSTRTVRPRKAEFHVANLTLDLLERLAAPPRYHDPLREWADGREMNLEETLELHEALFGPLSPSVREALDHTDLVLRIERERVFLGRSYLEDLTGAGMEIWTVTANFEVGGRKVEDRFSRITPSR